MLLSSSPAPDPPAGLPPAGLAAAGQAPPPPAFGWAGAGLGAASAGAPPGGPLRDAAQRALRDAPGRIGLLIATGEAAVPPHRRRVLKVLLQDAAQSGGGQVFETRAGDLLLLGAEAGAAGRAAAALDRLGGRAPPRCWWRLPEDGEALLAWTETASLPPPPPPDPAPAELAGLDATLAALPLERLARRHPILLLRLGANPALAATRLSLSAPLLANELGRLAADPDVLRHAEDRIAARLPELLSSAVLPPGPAGEHLLLPLPRAGWLAPAPRPGLVGVLPLAAAADPARWQARAATLRGLGWGLALAGLDAAALPLLLPDALLADTLLLHWSPALADAALAGSLERIDPARLVLCNCDEEAPVVWGAARGIRRFAGPHIEALLAALRMAACPSAAECSQRQCGERAAATAAPGRTGCRNPTLLAAMLPALGE